MGGRTLQHTQVALRRDQRRRPAGQTTTRTVLRQAVSHTPSRRAALLGSERRRSAADDAASPGVIPSGRVASDHHSVDRAASSGCASACEPCEQQRRRDRSRPAARRSRAGCELSGMSRDTTTAPSAGFEPATHGLGIGQNGSFERSHLVPNGRIVAGQRRFRLVRSEPF